jgi:hypothetical protein
VEQAFEKLGSFYLGRVRDLERQETTSEYVLYDSKDLTTHAVCVGMTGSGKTGLCVALLEEAGIDGIPAIVVDPKGDIGNLLLTFPELQPSDFRPWVEEAEAARHSQSVEQYAEQVANEWRQGLADWGQDGERIRRLRDAVELAVYTPGSSAGQPLTILKSFAAPPPSLIEDVDAYRDRVTATTAGLLALLGIDADPVRSREFILISNLLDRAWRESRDMDLAGLIHQIQAPPMTRIGVMDVDTFFPEKDRQSLSMTLNSLLASPAFAAWLEGDALDIQRLLYTPAGKPRISILSIAHLSEAERMFFVTILLNELLTWVRSQAGTSSLRALFYMDEVFGYFPPVANPPSKQPMLTLLKQARAYGLGLVLATQNPVDLDYKGLANCGTWFLGRLQTERDKARVLDGLEGASAQAGANLNRAEMDKVLSALGKRTFLLNNVHETKPVVFQTRWAMSYLRGPLTREQIRTLTKDRRATASSPAEPAFDAASSLPSSAPTSAPVATPPVTAEAVPTDAATVRFGSQPALPATTPQLFLAVDESLPSQGKLVYCPALLGSGKLHFVRAAYRIDCWQERQLLVTLDGGVDERIWERSQVLSRALTTRASAEPLAEFAELPAGLLTAKPLAAVQQRLKEYLYSTQTLEVLHSPAFKEYSQPGEDEGSFQIRVMQRAREQRDVDVEKLRTKYAAKMETLQDKIRRAQEMVDRQQTELQERSVDTAISLGSSIFGALFGRKTFSSKNVERASSTARRAGRVAKEKQDVTRARENLDTLLRQRGELEQQIQQDVERIDSALQAVHTHLERLQLPPKKTDITLAPLAIVWLPCHLADDGSLQPAYVL